MAKRKGFDFNAFMDIEALEKLSEETPSIAPSKEEIEIVTESKGDIEMLPVAKLEEYHNHTFSVLDDEDMEALCDSIKDMGIILPLLVRRAAQEKYEVISGHRRLFAARKVGIKEAPCKIVDVDDATADIMMVDTNLHREEILPSDKARSYDVKIKAMKEKGMLDEESASESQYEELLAKDIKSSKINIYRYRKLNNLIPPLLDMVDKKTLSVNAGAKLASVAEEDQTFIVEACEETKAPITIELADKIATAAKSGLTKDKVLGIIGGEFKPRKRKASAPATTIKEKNIKSAYPKSIASLTASEKEAFISDCIQEYLKNHDAWKGHALI